jgi:hypothetical protein
MGTARYILLILFVLNGCASKQTALTNTWHSPTSTPEQRIIAATKLIPAEATKAEVIELLGASGRWTHWHGSGVSIYPENGKMINRQENDQDEWTLEYSATGGTIAVFFEKKSDDDFRFVRVAFRKSLEVIPSP